MQFYKSKTSGMFKRLNFYLPPRLLRRCWGVRVCVCAQVQRRRRIAALLCERRPVRLLAAEWTRRAASRAASAWRPRARARARAPLAALSPVAARAACASRRRSRRRLRHPSRPRADSLRASAQDAPASGRIPRAVAGTRCSVVQNAASNRRGFS